MAELTQQHASADSWLIPRNPRVWGDIKAFLQEDSKMKIRVWGTLAPTRESPPHNRNFSEAFRLDYKTWGKEIDALNVREPARGGRLIDDFV